MRRKLPQKNPGVRPAGLPPAPPRPLYSKSNILEGAKVSVDQEDERKARMLTRDELIQMHRKVETCEFACDQEGTWPCKCKGCSCLIGTDKLFMLIKSHAEVMGALSTFKNAIRVYEQDES